MRPLRRDAEKSRLAALSELQRDYDAAVCYFRRTIEFQRSLGNDGIVAVRGWPIRRSSRKDHLCKR
jgi:hypothetical protein